MFRATAREILQFYYRNYRFYSRGKLQYITQACLYIYINSKVSYTKVNSHIKYLIHIYLHMFQVSVCNKALLCEKALTRNLEIAKIESLSVDDIMRTKNASVIKFVFHSCLKYIFLISL